MKTKQKIKELEDEIHALSDAIVTEKKSRADWQRIHEILRRKDEGGNETVYSNMLKRMARMSADEFVNEFFEPELALCKYCKYNADDCTCLGLTKEQCHQALVESLERPQERSSNE